MWDEEISDFLGAIEKAGFKKFGFFSKSTGDLRNIVAFTKAGWGITGTFEIPNAFEEYKPDEGLTFEKKAKDGGNPRLLNKKKKGREKQQC